MDCIFQNLCPSGGSTATTQGVLLSFSKTFDGSPSNFVDINPHRGSFGHERS